MNPILYIYISEFNAKSSEVHHLKALKKYIFAKHHVPLRHSSDSSNTPPLVNKENQKIYKIYSKYN